MGNGVIINNNNNIEIKQRLLYRKLCAIITKIIHMDTCPRPITFMGQCSPESGDRLVGPTRSNPQSSDQRPWCGENKNSLKEHLVNADHANVHVRHVCVSDSCARNHYHHDWIRPGPHMLVFCLQFNYATKATQTL